MINGLLSGAEIAVISVRATRLRELVDSGRASANALARLRADPERFLATVQVGITVVGATAAAFGGASFSEKLTPAIAGVPMFERYAEQIALALVISLISFLSVVIGELVPKSLALRTCEPYALLAARPLLALAALAAPAVWILTRSSNLILRVFKDRTTFTEARVSIDELRHVVGEAARTGSIDAGTSEIASRAFELADLTAADVMIHRRFVVALARDASTEELRRALLESGHRRIPIFERSIDSVVGYVSWRDVFERVWSGREPVLSEILRPAFFVPDTRAAASLLREMREKRVHLAIVLDEHGGMAGIVTLEDLLEEIVGEIDSEHDPQVASPDAHEKDGSMVFPGTASIRDVERALDVDLGPRGEEFATIGGLCVALSGDKIPTIGERLRVKAVEIEILDASPRRVRSLRVRRI